MDGPVSGGRQNAGLAVRVDQTIRRPRRPGSEVVEALLVHLAEVGFEAAPRFHGLDEEGRQILDYVPGDVYRQPPWQLDDTANATRLGELAAVLRRLHGATATFEPPAGATPARPLPLTGATWTHGDPGYPNVVYRKGVVAALIDWEFAAPGDPLCDPAALLALSVRGPRPDAADHDRRAEAARLGLTSIADGYGMDDALRHRLPEAAAVVLEDTAAHWSAGDADAADVDRLVWRAEWFRTNGEALLR